MNPIKKFGFLTSSVDPNNLSKTVEGIILGASVFIIYVARHFGIDLGTTQISDLAITAGTIVSSLVVLFGLIRKLVVIFTPSQTPPVVQVAPTDTLPPLE